MYGIKNCDTVKKARAFLDSRGIDYRFHDYKSEDIDRAHLEAWCGRHGWATICNRAGTTFRQLPDEAKADLTEPKAIDLMLAQPSMIKRPILERGGTTLVGFSPASYEEMFRTKTS